jgi:hypothetical protein
MDKDTEILLLKTQLYQAQQEQIRLANELKQSINDQIANHASYKELFNSYMNLADEYKRAVKITERATNLAESLKTISLN